MAEDIAGVVNEIVEEFGRDRSRLMDIARAVHARLGHLSEEVTGQIHQSLGIHRVEARDMASFYAFFSREKQGKYVIHVCMAVVERMKGADAIAAAFEKELGIGMGETTADGLFTLKHTACIGMSDQAPGALINGHPVTDLCPADIPALVAALRSGADPAQLPQAEIELNLRKTGPVIFAPLERGAAIRKAVNLSPDEVINTINKARLRGRGGAGFPTAMKWNFCRKARGNTHYLICNGDEGEPGTFKDRVILTEHPNLLFEGMTVAGYAIGAEESILYLRGEYQYLLPHLQQVLAKRRSLGMLGKNICGREGFNFDIRIQLGAGAYICGEESALIESLEGKRGAPRDRPPFPVQHGFKDEPTSVNNVETLCCAARILEQGPEWFSALGAGESTGTKLLSISGDCEHPGVYEVEYGISVEKLLELTGGEGAQAVQIGGASGACIAPKDFGRAISFEDLPTGGSIMIFGPDRDLLECMRRFLEFFAEESCGWCAPCRVGTTLLLKMMDKVLAGRATQADLDKLEELGKTVKTMSRCGLGQTAPNPVLTTLQNFSGLYADRIAAGDYTPAVDIQRALREAAEITGRTAELEGHQV
jgi:[NiFe] hydrogenase diaphorase moiety large subunit